MIINLYAFVSYFCGLKFIIFPTLLSVAPISLTFEGDSCRLLHSSYCKGFLDVSRILCASFAVFVNVLA